MEGQMPSPLTIFPPQLLATVEKDFWNFNGTGFSYSELSHRSAHYVGVNNRSQELMRSYLGVPENYEVLYLPTDCSYPSIPFNLSQPTANRAIYIVRDRESELAYTEALKINPKVVKATEEGRGKIFEGEGLPFYTLYSLHSFEEGKRHGELQPREGEILVCSIDRCSHYETVDVSQHGAVMFQTGRGVGLSGMSVVVVRKDLVGQHMSTCPDMMDYQKTVKACSVINTPFTLVPLMILKQLDYWFSEGKNPCQMKKDLALIKLQFEEALGKRTEVVPTEMEGVVRFKKPTTLSNESAEEYGIVDGEWLVVALQLPNRGAGHAFGNLMFGDL